MSVRSDVLFIGGEWRTAAGGLFDEINPATGEPYATVANANGDDSIDAVEAAAAAQPAWAALSPGERAKIVNRFADSLEAMSLEFVDALVDEGGSWIVKAKFEASASVDFWRHAAAQAYQVKGELHPSDHGKVSMLVREPVGVVAAISPWNFPMLLSSRAINTAIAVGNTVVLKPSEETPVSGGLLFAAAAEAAELPPGVLNVLTCSRANVGEVGDCLLSHPAVGSVSFTGSTAVGREIGATAGRNLKKVSLELGGKDAFLVLDDADIEKAATAASFSSFMHAGQICMSTERIIVDNAVLPDFVDRFVARVKKLTVGDPRHNVIGPIINDRQADKIRSQIADAVDDGAELVLGGGGEGRFVEPTVLTAVTPHMAVFRDETFGPVAPIIGVDGVDEAVLLANDSTFGLSAGVFTSNEERGLEVAGRLETGMVHINDGPVNDAPYTSFGGAKNSGVGRMGGSASIDNTTTTRWLTLDRGGRPYPPAF